jgi:glutathione-independent formaldehyde dehydrogenase
MKPGKVEIQTIDYPKFIAPNGKEIDHGVILRIVSTNICGSDQHMVRGRTTAPAGLVLGHEITGEVIEKGHDVEFLEIGDLVSVPFNVACGRCRNCREQKTGICLNVNPARPWWRVRLRRYGRMDRRSSRVRDGPQRRLQSLEVPG